jgi:hypothetical protein
VLSDRGEYRAAVPLLRQARKAAARGGFARLEVEATVEQGRAHLLAGRRRATVVALARARHVAAAGPSVPAGHVQLLEAELALHEGCLPEAQTAAQEALHLACEGEARRGPRLWLAEFSQGRPLQGRALRLLGVCSLRSGAPGEALPHLRAALALQLELGAALEAARTRLWLAQALAAGGGTFPDEARTLLTDARAQFSRSGASVDLAEAERVAHDPATR